MKEPTPSAMSQNSLRFNRFVEVTPTNDNFELWSLPWHALQRRLAKGFSADTADIVSASLKLSAAPGLVKPAGSWLVRARRAAPTSHVNR